MDKRRPFWCYGPAMAAAEPRERKDVVRNRQRILDAAKALFAERGLSVTLHDIARHAGVGVGTIYRHYPDKAVLIDLLFEEQLEGMADLARQALEDPDPWHAVVWFHEQSLELQSRDKGLRELLLGMPDAPELAVRFREKLHPLAGQIIERAQAAGVVRHDCETQDFGVVVLMVGAVIDAASELSPELWRRYLTIALQGLRPASPPGPLPVPAVSPEQMEQLLVGAWKHRS
jgi:AcrR family transcriptional regulator